MPGLGPQVSFHANGSVTSKPMHYRLHTCFEVADIRDADLRAAEKPGGKFLRGPTVTVQLTVGAVSVTVEVYKTVLPSVRRSEPPLTKIIFKGAVACWF